MCYYETNPEKQLSGRNVPPFTQSIDAHRLHPLHGQMENAFNSDNEKQNNE